MTGKKTPEAFAYIDLPHVPEAFADDVQTTHVDGTTARIVLSVHRIEEFGPPRPTGTKVTAARLVLTLPAFTKLHNQIRRVMAGLEARGLVKREGEELNPTIQ